ncbi:MAG: porin [Sterolibacterium sp.]|nr:porin [Sterolibacterium sp.]
MTQKTRFSSLLVALLSTSLTVASGSSSAMEPEDASLRLSGFGTLGMAHTQGDGAAFIRDITQPKGATNRGISFDLDTRLGIQLNYQINDSFEAVAQVVTRYRNENNYWPELTWGFLKYTYDDVLEVRAGRIGYDGYIGADTRDVGYSYLWARPPVEYFGTLLFPYHDGVDIVLRAPVMRGVGRIKLYSGLTRQRVNNMMEQREWATALGPITLPPMGATQDLNKSRETGGYVEYQDTHWTGRLGISSLRLAKGMPNPLDTALSAIPLPLAESLRHDIQLIGRRATYKTAELAYEDGPLKLQGAYARITSSSLLIPRGHSAFVSAGYRFGRFTPYVTVSALRTKSSDYPQRLAASGPPLEGLAELAQFTLSSPLSNQNTYTLGLRYDFADNFALKLQADMIRNKNCSPVALPGMGLTPCAPPLLWPTVPPNWNGRANVYSAVLDFIF